jgi:HEAT repeats
MAIACAERTVLQLLSIKPPPEGGTNSEEFLPETVTLPSAPDCVSSLEEAIRQLDPSDPELDTADPDAGAAAVQRAAPKEAGEALLYWLARYSRNPSEAARNIRELAANAPERMLETALPLFQAGDCGEGGRCLASVLTRDSGTVLKLCDPAASLEGSICIAKALMKHEPRFDARFAKSLLHDDRMTEAARERGLAVLEKLGSSGRLIPILIQFLRDPADRIRSKTALLFGQIVSTRGIADRLIGDADARVRANFVEGLWNCAASFDCRPLFRRALDDPNHRVAANALIGLDRLGETRIVIAHVSKMARSPDARMRSVGAWVMGRTDDQRYGGLLRQMLRDQDARVRLRALRSLRRINLAHAAKPPSEDHPNSGTPGDGSAPAST